VFVPLKELRKCRGKGQGRGERDGTGSGKGEEGPATGGIQGPDGVHGTDEQTDGVQRLKRPGLLGRATADKQTIKQTRQILVDLD